MTRPTDFADSMMNSATSSAADPVTISTFQQDADADTFFSAPASRWASCRSHNQKVQAARRVANGARRDRTGIPAIPADEVLIETLVLAIARQRRIMGEIEAGPLQDEEGKINPLLRVAESTAATVGSMARALGLGPTARQRLPKAAPAPQKAPSIWDGVKP